MEAFLERSQNRKEAFVDAGGQLGRCRVQGLHVAKNARPIPPACPWMWFSPVLGDRVGCFRFASIQHPLLLTGHSLFSVPLRDAL